MSYVFKKTRGIALSVLVGLLLGSEIKGPNYSGANYIYYHREQNPQKSSANIQSDMNELVQTKFNSIAIVLSQYVKDTNSYEIKPVEPKKINDLYIAIQDAKNKNITIMLKPHVNIADGTARERIKFKTEADWKKWFDNYEKFILQYAKIAKEQDLEMLCIGTELEGTVKRPEWGKIIREIKKEYPGKLIYSSIDYRVVPFWKELNYIGVNYYPWFKINKKEVSSEDIMAKIEKDSLFQNLRKLSIVENRKVIFTEWGYNYKCPEKETWTWFRGVEPTPNDQIMYYSAFLKLYEKYEKNDFLRGSFLWAWNSRNSNSEEKYSPKRNKPAVKILMTFFSDEKYPDSYFLN